MRGHDAGGRRAPAAAPYAWPAPGRLGQLIGQGHRAWSPGLACVRRGRNQALYSCGERDTNLYLIESGRVKTLSLSSSGKECVLGIYGWGDVVGESCLVEEERSSTAVAMAPAVLTRVPRQRFFEIVGDSGILEDWLRYLALRLSEQQQVITSMVTSDSEQRLAAALLRLGHRLGTRHADRLLLEQRITQEELAGMVGTTRSRVGHFLKKFRPDGLIDAPPESHLVIHHRRPHR